MTSSKRQKGKNDRYKISDPYSVLNEFAGKSEAFTSVNGIHELFEIQVEKTPDAIAVEYLNEKVSYRDLNDRALVLANKLIEYGLGREQFVCLILDRSIEMIVAILSVLKAGGAYVPIDPKAPPARIKDLISDVGAKFLISSANLLVSTGLNLKGIRIISFDSAAYSKLTEKSGRILNKGNGGDLAYMLYTSGSTGQPKGVMITHDNARNYLQYIAKVHPLGVGEKMLFKTPYTFDVSVPDIFHPLSTGATVVVAEADKHADMNYLAKLIRDAKICEAQFVPSALSLFLDDPIARECRTLKIVTAAGEVLPIETVKKFYQVLPHAKLINAYGPTEGGFVTYAELSNEFNGQLVTIGKPVPNNRIYILDENGAPLEPGSFGELYIGGVQVARGYWNRQDLTAERFVKDPFSSDPKSRMYKTGDRARFLPDGNIEYQGRLDFQIKIRGMRVELGEIEAVIASHPNVSLVAGIYRKSRSDDMSGSIIAYVVPKLMTVAEINSNDPELIAKKASLKTSLNEFLMAKLPEYMVPQGYVLIDKIPSTTSGKIDRAALVARNDDVVVQKKDYVEPANELEAKLALIWQAVLGVERVGREDQFYSLGGESLLAVKLVSRIRKELGAEVPVSVIYYSPKLKDFAVKVQVLLSAGRVLEKLELKSLPRSKLLPLSSAQSQMWLREQIFGDEQENICDVLTFNGELDIEALKRAIESVVDRHEILRTRVTMLGEVAYQRFVEPGQFGVGFEDLSNIVSETQRTVEVEARISSEVRSRFDIYNGWMIRAHIYRLNFKNHVLVLNLHHIISDHWSMRIFQREMSAYYARYMNGHSPGLEQLNIQYADYAMAEAEFLNNKAAVEQEVQFWKSELKDVNWQLNLPTGVEYKDTKELPRVLIKSQMINGVLTKLISNFSEKNNTTPYLTLLTVLEIFLSRISGQTNFVIGTFVAGRVQVDVDTLMGPVINTVPLQADLSGNPNITECLRRAEARAIIAMDHPLLPIDKIIDAVKPKGAVPTTSPIRVILNYMNDRFEDFNFESAKVIKRNQSKRVWHSDLVIEVHENEEFTELTWIYNSKMFLGSTIEKMNGVFVDLLKQCLEVPEKKVDDLKVEKFENQSTLNQPDGSSGLSAYQLDLAQIKEVLKKKLPEHMVPTLMVQIDEMPLTTSGKIDRQALVKRKDEVTISAKQFVPPIDGVEVTLADAWQSILGVSRVSRDDNFFELGGDSLGVIRVLQILRTKKIELDAKDLYGQSTISDLGALVRQRRNLMGRLNDNVDFQSKSSFSREEPSPGSADSYQNVSSDNYLNKNLKNRIPEGCRKITPEMLGLIKLTETDIDMVVKSVSGGVENIQDIYPLSPLQEGMLYHHMIEPERDPYVLFSLSRFDSKSDLDIYVSAFRKVVDRHDVLRSAVLWEGLSQPIQVVCKSVTFELEETRVPVGLDVREHFKKNFEAHQYAIEIRKAPMFRLIGAEDSKDGGWLLVELWHHLVFDHEGVATINYEISEILAGRENRLLPVVQFRDYVARAIDSNRIQAADKYFQKMLGDVEEPTHPYGLASTIMDSSALRDEFFDLGQNLSRRIRAIAKIERLTPASLFHLAFGRLLSVISGQKSVVFGTVLLGRSEINAEPGSPALGLYINTLPIKVITNGRTVLEEAKHLRDTLGELIGCEAASLAKVQTFSKVPKGENLFTAILNYRHNRPQTLGQPQIQSIKNIQVLNVIEYTNYPLSVSINDNVDSFSIDASLVRTVDINSLLSTYSQILENIVACLESGGRSEVDSIEFMGSEDKKILLAKFSGETREYEKVKCLHELFELQADKTPSAIALEFGNQSITYRELEVRANQAAHHLVSIGVGPNKSIAIFMDRSVDMIVGILATLKAGAGYVPIDIDYPLERINYLLNDIKPEVVLTHKNLDQRIPIGYQNRIYNYDNDPLEIFRTGKQTRVEVNCKAEDMAFMIFTSGTTGMPKGALNSHRGIVNYIQALNEFLPLSNADRVLFRAAVIFDTSVQEIFWPLSVGACVVIAEPGGHRDLDYLEIVFSLKRITCVEFIPSLLSEYINLGKEMPETMRIVTVGGERLAGQTITDFARIYPKIKLVNTYGPAETAVAVTGFVCDGKANSLIGKPLLNNRIYILDDRGRLVPPGVVGELCIGGTQVGIGYFNRPELTSEKFMKDPFSGSADARIYKTGDRAKFLADGNIEYLGRVDSQIKIRGMRVELGEIESTLLGHKGVSLAAVIYRKPDEGALTDYLVAYVVPLGWSHDEIVSTSAEIEANRQALTNSITSFLKSKLPDHMIPRAVMYLSELPTTASGKIDRKSLSDRNDKVIVKSDSYMAPIGEIEQSIAKIWSEILQVERVSRSDNFFKMGGHSLSAARLISRVRANFKVLIPINLIFDWPVLADFSQKVALSSGQKTREVILKSANPTQIPKDCRRIEPSMVPLCNLSQKEIDYIVERAGGPDNISDIYSLGPLQEGILFQHNFESVGDTYLSALLISFTSKRSLDEYIIAYEKVINRHEVLRSGFFWQNISQPVQVVFKKVHLVKEQIENLNKEKPIAQQLIDLFNPLYCRIDLTLPPLFKFYISWDQENQRWLLLNLNHHIMLDHESLAIIDNELALILEGKDHLLKRPLQYRTYISSVRQINKKNYEKFFKEMLEGTDTLTAPYGLQGAQVNPKSIFEHSIHFDSEISKKINVVSKNIGVSAASIFHTAYAALLSSVSNQSDILFGTVLWGRSGLKFEDNESAVGLYINTLPIRVRLQKLTVLDCVTVVHRQLGELANYESVPLHDLHRLLGRNSAGQPLFNSLLNYRHSMANEQLGEDSKLLSGARYEYAYERANYPLVVSVDNYGDDFWVTTHASLPISAKQVAENFAFIVENLIRHLENNPNLGIDEIETVSYRQQSLIIDKLRGPKVEFDQASLIHEIFEANSINYPNQIAVEDEVESYNYSELNQASNRICHFLSSIVGVKRPRVAVVLRCSCEQQAIMLAVLKLGGTYVPIDLDLPDERKAFIINDIKPEVVITHSTEFVKNISSAVAVITFDKSLREKLTLYSSENYRNQDANNIAYVIYTSGSTGRPKGCLNTHKGFLNTVLGDQTQTKISSRDRFLTKTSISFDSSILEAFRVWAVGATLVILPRKFEADPIAILEYADVKQITATFFVPTMLAEVLKQPQFSDIELKTVIVAGEAFQPGQVRQFFSMAPNTRLIVQYGPSEAGCAVSSWEIAEAKSYVAPIIGKPLANMSFCVVDNHDRIVPLGAVGELVISGPQVGVGYWCDEVLTKQKFVRNIRHLPDEVSYRTGDLVRLREDFQIEFVGRNDSQVKIRGYRIDTGEVEQIIREIIGVDQVVVAVSQRSGESYLVCYIENDSIELNVGGLRDKLRNLLPVAMIPAKFIVTNKFPTLPNGKADRKALGILDENQIVSALPLSAPLSGLEFEIAKIWKEILSVDSIRRESNFFEMGGNSLSAVRMISSVRKNLGFNIGVTMIFEFQTLSQFSKAVESRMSIDTTSVLRRFKSGNGDGVLILLPALDGDLAAYASLLSKIAFDGEIYGLQSKEFLAAPKIFTVKEIVKIYLDEIRKISRPGPMIMMGWSFGGILANELAISAASQGLEIDLVLLLDTFVGKKPKKDRSIKVDRFMSNILGQNTLFELDVLRQLNSEQKAKLFVAAMNELFGVEIRKHDDFSNNDFVMYYKLFFETASEFQLRAFFNNIVAAENYAVEKMFSGKVRLLATGASNSNEVYTTSEWAKFNSPLFASIKVPGNHYSLLKPPNVNSLADIINSLIEVELNSRRSIKKVS